MGVAQSRRTCVHRMRPHAFVFGIVLSLFLALAWSIGQPPATVHASGVPYCEKLAEEHAPTRPSIHLNHTEGTSRHGSERHGQWLASWRTCDAARRRTRAENRRTLYPDARLRKRRHRERWDRHAHIPSMRPRSFVSF